MPKLILRLRMPIFDRCGPVRRLRATVQAQAELAKMAGWSFASAVIARSANLLALMICARLLSLEQFGLVAIIQSTVGMFGPIAGLGLSVTTTKFLAEYRDKDRARAGRILAMSFSLAVFAGALMTAALILFAPQLATNGLGSAALTRPLIQASGLLLLSVIESVQTGALVGLEAFSRIAHLSVWNGVLSIPVVALLAYKYGASGAIAGLTIALLWTCVLNGIILHGECRKRDIHPSFTGWAQERNVLFMFSLPSYVSGIVVAPITWMTSALLVKQSGGLAEMALFSAADRFRFLLIFVPIAVSRIAVPTLTRLHAAGDSGGYRNALRWNVGFGVLATIPPVLLCMSLSRPLMMSFGKTFGDGWPVLAVLAFSAIPTVLNTQLGAPLLSENRAWTRTGIDAALAVTFLLSAWWMVPIWKALGLAMAFAVAYSCACLLLWISLRNAPNRARKDAPAEQEAPGAPILVKSS